jgi:NAD(P)-dependent dehydrogenase (short-subunit alcohol dehydrogenase family)
MAAKTLSAKLGEEKLYGLVNNAGVLSGDLSTMIKTNIYGPKYMCDNFIPLLSPTEGRIVNVSSDVSVNYISKGNMERVRFFTNNKVTWEELEAHFNSKQMSFGLSKAILNSYTMILARTYPNILSSSAHPGFIDTRATKGMGSKKTP